MRNPRATSVFVRNATIATAPNTRRLPSATRTYSIGPAPITRSLRESFHDSTRSHTRIRAAEKDQYDTVLSRESSLIANWALPVPNHAIWAPKTTHTSARKSVIHSRR